MYNLWLPFNDYHNMQYNFYLMIVIAVLTEGQTTYRYQTSTISWTVAKTACECEGNLAILDTEEKQTQLLDDMYV